MKQSLSTGLEAVRGLSSLVVLVAHALQWFVWPLVGSGSAVVSATQHAAHFAVLVFFALSGYVISFSMSRNAADSGVLNEAAYIRARAIRILPPFVFALILSLLIAGMIEAIGLPALSVQGASGEGYTARTTATTTLRNVVATALLSNGIVPGTGAIATNGPLWSLSFEVWLYLCSRCWRGSRSREKGALQHQGSPQLASRSLQCSRSGNRSGLPSALPTGRWARPCFSVVICPHGRG